VQDNLWEQTMPDTNLKELVDRLTTGPTPHLALKAARADGTLARLIPELDVLAGIPQSAQYHSEIDCFIHMEMVVEVAAALTDRPRARFAALVHDFGKGATPEAEWPKHVSHEKRGVPLVEAFCARLGAPPDWTLLGMLTSKWHLEVHKAFTLRAGSVVKLFVESGFIHDPLLFEDFLLACEADKRGRGGQMNTDYRQRPFLLSAMEAVKAVTAPETSLNAMRCEAVKQVAKGYL
jgi:tRNA nucleotidyltransferase (CCA-adding enzyme)